MKRFQFWKYSWVWIATFALVVFFSSWILVQHYGIFISPDETANAYFSEIFSETGQLFAYDALSHTFQDVIHPRSIFSVEGRLLPGSFLGLPVLFGSIASIIGQWSLPWITPLLALLAVFAWYALLRRVFIDKVALYATLLLAIHPAWWYYSARSMMHNVLFTSFVIFAGFFLLVRPFNHWLKSTSRFFWLSSLDLVLSAGCLGVALFARPSEVFWLALVGLIVMLWYRKTWKIKQVVLFLVALVIALLPLFIFNQITYGGPFTFGYTALEDGSAVATEILIDQTDVLAPAREVWYRVLDNSVIQTIFPFGIHPKTILEHTAGYLVLLFWWLAIPAIIGLPLLLLRKNVSKKHLSIQRLYFVLFIFVTVWLGLMYGSWTFFDNPDPTQVTIANSYVRYWLPIYVLSTPLIALTMHRLSQKAVTKNVKQFIVIGFFIIFVFMNIFAVFFRGEDSLQSISQTLSESEQVREFVLEATETESLIIVDRADKLFFPYRRVLYPLRDDQTYELMSSVILHVPLYYYGITLPQEDVDYLNQRKLKEQGLFIELMQTFDEETLYRIGSL